MRISKRYKIPKGDRESRHKIGDFSKGVNYKTDEAALPLSYATRTYNYRLSGGTLKNAPGFTKYVSPIGYTMKEVPSPPMKVWHYKRYNYDTNLPDDRIILYCEDTNMYYLKLNDLAMTYTKLIGATFSNIPVAVNYHLNGEDVMIFCANKEGMLIWDGKNAPVRYADSPAILSMAVHYERLFATVAGPRTAVWFSEDLDPSNWNISMTEGGFIEMFDDRGALNKVVSFLDYLYVFREYGITRITAYGDQSQFSVTQLYTGSGKIYSDTVTVCGDRIYFLASDGLYMFDGLSANKIYRHLDGMWGDNFMATGAFHNGKFYLACKIKYGDGKILNGIVESSHKNSVIEIDVASNDLNIIRGINIQCFCSCRSDLINKLIYVFTDATYGKFVGEFNDSGTFFGNNSEKCWQSPVNDFGSPEKMKIIKSVSLISKYDTVLTVKSELEERVINISGTEGIQKHRVNVKGSVISFEFLSSTAKADIANPVFEVITR